jgi:hypothetical protein
MCRAPARVAVVEAAVVAADPAVVVAAVREAEAVDLEAAGVREAADLLRSRGSGCRLAAVGR